MEIKFTNEDRKLFGKIKNEIIENCEEYREAGKWLDEYFDLKSSWFHIRYHYECLCDKIDEDRLPDNYTQDKLNCKVGLYHAMIETKVYTFPDEYYGHYAIIIEEIQKSRSIKEGIVICGKQRFSNRNIYKFADNDIETKVKEQLKLWGKWKEQGVEKLDRFLLNWHSLPHESICLSLEEAQRAIVVTWLLSDPEANKLNLRITEFENWPWSDYPQTGRDNLIKKLLGKLADWMELVRLAWDKISLEKTLELKKITSQQKKIEQKTNKIETEKVAQWKPPKGYIGSKTIVADYGIPRTTLQGWAEIDEAKVKKDKQTRENYYQKTWLDKRYKNYTPRSRT